MNVNMDRNRMQKIRNEAIIMEQLTNSPHISDTYGHCAFSLLVEMAPVNIADTIQPQIMPDQHHPGKIDQKKLDEYPDVHPINNLTAVEKLDLAIGMLSGLADIHGMATGPVVMGDVAPNQWLQTASGRIILNDFDNSRLASWNVTGQQYCKDWSYHVGGYKAPEEVDGGNLDESTDKWKAGAILFALLTGLDPYYDEGHREDDKMIDNNLRNGVAPHIDPRYATRSFIEGRMVEIMNKCFQFKPQDRADVFEVLEHLRETKRLHEETKKNKNEEETHGDDHEGRYEKLLLRQG
jgi:serine/threonine protein kinase